MLQLYLCGSVIYIGLLLALMSNNYIKNKIDKLELESLDKHNYILILIVIIVLSIALWPVFLIFQIFELMGKYGK